MKLLLILLVTVSLCHTVSSPTKAVYDPTTLPNNKFGVHILDVAEVESAAQLVNSNGGDWGYVTVPIQPSDREVGKWQNFLNQCQNLHLIPIIRITTIPLGGTWTEGHDTDLVDFANFLAGLTWPTGNRYIVLFNEVNRHDEWGGVVDPAAYAQIVKNASAIFKERSSDFFLLGPALDSALPDSPTSMSAASFLLAMQAQDPQIWSSFDGWASHSYPNPDFRSSPSRTGWQSLVSYRTETAFLNTGHKPVFITETGWDTTLPASTLTSYWNQAWNLWNRDDRVVSVTPFVLRGGSQFHLLSLLGEDGTPTPSYQAILAYPKESGSPGLELSAGSTPLTSQTTHNSAPVPSLPASGFLLAVENFFRRLLGLLPRGYISVNGQLLSVELATTPASWERGLSGRASLPEGHGLLFIFPSAHVPAFWMKDMHFDLDLIWIRDNVIVELTPDVPRPTGPDLPTYSPAFPSDMVLELPAGSSATIGLAVGDPLSLVK